MHELVIVFPTLDQFKAQSEVVSHSLTLVDRCDLAQIVLLAKLDMLFHVVKSVSCDLDEKVLDLVSHLSGHDVLQTLKVLA